MHLRKRLSKEVLGLGMVFVSITIIMTVLFLQYSHSVNSLITEADPALDALGYMLSAVYKDDMLLTDYLKTADYNTILQSDELFAQSSQGTQQVIDEVEELINSAVISDEKIIAQFAIAKELNDDIVETRNQIIAVHKEDVQTPADLNFDKNILLDVHQSNLNKAAVEFSQIIQQINSRNAVLRQGLLLRAQLYFGLMIVLFIVFLVLLALKIKKFSTTIVKPIDETISKAQEFVDGDYTVSLNPFEGIEEIGKLQANINKVFDVIHEQAKNPVQKAQIDEKLLSKDHLAIIDFIKMSSELHRKVTISDLKKHLNVTHPTVLSRLNYLEEKGMVSLKKEGRAKFLHTEF
ncbi:hypothetical protein GOV09_01485 [Candidatus Woesearchaeota archaeon]|nr:hypothetical protein [Candidatus Woesearchaeota archaeon]